MNERINSVIDLRFRSNDSDNDMGRRRLNNKKSNKKDLNLDFDSIFQKELKRARKEN